MLRLITLLGVAFGYCLFFAVADAAAVDGKTIYVDSLSQPFPTVVINQTSDNLLQGNAVQGIVYLLFCHKGSTRCWSWIFAGC